MEEEGVGSRTEFLARVQRFADAMLERFNEASSGKDVDEKELRMLASLVLNLLGIWSKALSGGQRDSRLDGELGRVRKQASLGEKKGE